MSPDGRELIFLVSQPRSGSTLLQHVLASHPEIHTLPEPWLALHLASGRGDRGLRAPYNAEYAALALDGFLSRIEDGARIYDEAMRDAAARLYTAALESAAPGDGDAPEDGAASGDGARPRLFLDKTPRYYFIIEDLARWFPEARFVFLVRNPLAVMSSILETNFGGSFPGLFSEDRKHDLLTAPARLRAGAESVGERGVTVRYEDLVADPETSVARICRHLGVEFDAGMLEYGDKVRFDRSSFIDPKSIYRHSKPSAAYTEAWVERIDSPQKAHLARSYLHALGPDLVGAQGYDFHALDALVPASAARSFVPLAPWSALVEEPARRTRWQSLRLKVAVPIQLVRQSLRAHGVRRTLRRSAAAIFDLKRARIARVGGRADA